MVRIAALLLALQPTRVDGNKSSDVPDGERDSAEEADLPTETSHAEEPGDTDEAARATPNAEQLDEGRRSTTTDPFKKTPVPGFPPEVDLNDESTWVNLKPQEKDKLRAIRAGLRAKTAEYTQETTDPAGPTDDERAPGTTPKHPSARGASSKAAWWEARDRQLVATTVGFGVTWAVSLAATGIILAINAQNSDDCRTASNTLSEGDVDRCSEGATQSANLIVPTAIFGTVAGISMVGTIVSGSLLGGHRNSKGFVVAGPHSLGLGWTGRF